RRDSTAAGRTRGQQRRGPADAVGPRRFFFGVRRSRRRFLSFFLSFEPLARVGPLRHTRGMDPNPSNRWPIVTLELPGETLRPANPDDAVRQAEATEQGTLGATGEAGDCVELQFNRDHAAVLYMRPDLTILRPRFSNRAVTGDRIEEFFCECCGVQ